jgi:hypothetical protein
MGRAEGFDRIHDGRGAGEGVGEGALPVFRREEVVQFFVEAERR